jgi:hypothetical protein
MSEPSSPERRRSRAELGAMFLTVGLFLVFKNLLHLKLQFLIPAVVVWTAYVVHRMVRDRTLATRWGIRLDDLRSAAPPILGFFAAGFAALLAWHLAVGGPALPADAWKLFLFYPVWSFLQQFVLQALVASNLETLGLARAGIIPVAAALFGLAHLPNWPLSGLCAVAGLAWTTLYLRRRHLPLLALSHAWLGALAFYWVLQRNPWEIFNH